MSESPSQPLFGPEFLARLEALGVMARRSRPGSSAGTAAGRLIGDGLEFADHREYVVGDELRTLDWPAYARLGRLYVRRFHQHMDRIVHVLLDASGSMNIGAGERTPTVGADSEPASKFDSARRLAAAMAFLALAGLDRAAVTAWRSGQPDRSAAPPTLRGREQIFALLSYLERLTAEGTGDWPRAVRQYAESTTEPGLVVLLSDFLEDDPSQPWEPALEALRVRGHQVLAVQVVAPSEVNPLLATESVGMAGGGGRWMLTDVEHSETECRVSLSASLAEAYRTEWAGFAAELSRRLAAHRVELLTVNSDQPMEHLARELLRRGYLVG